MPAVLVEVAFLTNEDDRKKLLQLEDYPNFREEAADAIHNGILDSFVYKHATEKKICIDPGHGGTDPGARWWVEGNRALEKDEEAPEGATILKESYFNLEIAEELRKKFGENAVMTRTDDVFVKLEKRVAEAKDNNCSIFVSIHCNSVENPSYAPSIYDGAKGTETYYYLKRGEGGRYCVKYGVDTPIGRCVLVPVDEQQGFEKLRYDIKGKTLTIWIQTFCFGDTSDEIYYAATSPRPSRSINVGSFAVTADYEEFSVMPPRPPKIDIRKGGKDVEWERRAQEISLESVPLSESGSSYPIEPGYIKITDFKAGKDCRGNLKIELTTEGNIQNFSEHPGSGYYVYMSTPGAPPFTSDDLPAGITPSEPSKISRLLKYIGVAVVIIVIIVILVKFLI